MFLYLFYPIVFLDSIHYYSNLNFINLLLTHLYFPYVRFVFIVSLFVSNFILFYYFFKCIDISPKSENDFVVPNFGLFIGKDLNDNDVYITEKSLYQNILITGSIGSGKTSSAIYPFTKQLIEYCSNNFDKKIGFLILDVKGNYYSKVLEFAKNCNRLNDVIVISLNGKYKYNPLDKPNIKASVLANRLKNILLLFSPNNTESYWLDKVEQILECFINYCRIYNNGYVDFNEIHNLTIDYDYFKSKIELARNAFISGLLSKDKIYSLYYSISFLEKDFYKLDQRTHNLLVSEITRITGVFVSDYNVKKIFCPNRNEENFYGFKDVINKGKIVVLNMNISEYRNLSKIIATYLKMDFQTDVLKQLANSSSPIRTTCFISDEYQEYVTSSDADFFSQSRESKCINIISTQSYSSVLNSLNNKNATNVIIQNLVNKLWFRTDDIYTIEDIQKQIGKEEKTKTSTTYSENSKHSDYNFFTKNFTSIDSNLSESVNSYSQFEYIFDYNYFTQNLETFTCVGFLLNDSKIIKPQKISMIPYFKQKGAL